jgi:hypothetical protein
MKAAGLFERLLAETLHLTEDWSISDLITLFTSLYLLPSHHSLTLISRRPKAINSGVPTAR